MDTLIAICAGCGAKNRVPVDKNYAQGKCGRCGGGLSGSLITGQVLDLDDTRFSEVVNSSTLPVLIDFYSPTCGPCQMLSPILNTVARNFSGKAVIGKINTSVYQVQAAMYQIKGVPALLFFKNGKLVDQVVGAVPKENLKALVEKAI